MKRQFLIFIFSICFFPSVAQNAKPEFVQRAEVIVETSDSLIFEEKMQLFASKSEMPMGLLMIEIGKSFLGTPYVAQTLEKTPDEKLVINLRELDCTTFAENCLALARTFKLKEPSFDKFIQQLHLIRYRDGRRNGYPSRLHYFSEWLINNQSKKLLVLPVVDGLTDLNKQINFMSTHADSYPILKMKPELIGELKNVEESLNTHPAHFIPKEKLAAMENQIEEGDIAGITTSIDGLDMVHTVLLTHVDGRVHILHASSLAKKVILSEETFLKYLADGKKITGFMLGRPLVP